MDSISHLIFAFVVYELYFTHYPSHVRLVCVYLCARARVKYRPYVSVSAHFFRLAIMNFESDLSIYLGVCCCRRRFFFSPHPFFHLSPPPFSVPPFFFTGGCYAMRLLLGLLLYVVGFMRRPSHNNHTETHMIRCVFVVVVVREPSFN